MERQNRRLLANLTAWAEILDALGWSVALCLPGQEPLLSVNDAEVARRAGGNDAGLGGHPRRVWPLIRLPGNWLAHCISQVWAETEAAGRSAGHRRDPSPNAKRRNARLAP